MSVDFDRMAANLPADQRKQLSREYRRGAKNETTAFLSCFFLGIFGVHHFYLGKWTRGLAHLILPLVAALVLVAGVLSALPSLLVTIVVAALLVAGLIWEAADLFQIDVTVRKRNLALAESLIGADALADSTTLKDAVARLDGAVAGAGTPAAVLSGTITAEDVSAARAMAGEHNAIMEEFDSTTTKYLSDDPNATSPGAPVSWSETVPTQPAASAEDTPEDTLDMPAPEYVTHTHTETADTVTDTFEFDRSPDATQPMAIPTARESQAATWPDHPPLEEVVGEPVPEPADAGVPLAGLAAGAAAMGAGALLADAAGAADAAAAGPDVTDHHAYVPLTQPIADVEGAGAAPQYVALPDEQPMAMTAAPAPAAPANPVDAVPPAGTAASAGTAAEDAAGYAPLAVDASTTGHDATDTHPHAPHAGLVGDVEVNPAQPVYIDLPPETYVPPVVPVMDMMDASADDTLVGLAAAGAAAAYAGSQPDAPAETPPAAPEAMPEAAPASGPLMKRIRMKRQIVVDGNVVREEVVEKLVPVDTDTSELVAEMDTELGHASKEEIAHMANLDPDASLDLRQRTQTPHQDGEPSAE